MLKKKSVVSFGLTAAFRLSLAVPLPLLYPPLHFKHYWRRQLPPAMLLTKVVIPTPLKRLRCDIFILRERISPFSFRGHADSARVEVHQSPHYQYAGQWLQPGKDYANRHANNSAGNLVVYFAFSFRIVIFSSIPACAASSNHISVGLFLLMWLPPALSWRGGESNITLESTMEDEGRWRSLSTVLITAAMMG